MNPAQPQSNAREDARRTSSGLIHWRYPGDEKSYVGTVLESSFGGFALAWRGEDAPGLGAMIEVRFDDSSAGWTKAIVRHASNVHDNLRIFGLERYGRWPFHNVVAAPDPRPTAPNAVKLSAPRTMTLIKPSGGSAGRRTTHLDRMIGDAPC